MDRESKKILAMSLKLLVTGTFASGKSTLVALLSHCSLIQPVREVARDFLSRDSSLQDRADFQVMVLNEQLRREEEAERSGAPIVLCDRGTLDTYCYCKYYGHHLPLVPDTNRYDLVFLCSPGDICVQELYEEAGLVFRMQLALIFETTLHQFGFQYVELQGNPLNRAIQIVRCLKDHCGSSLQTELHTFECELQNLVYED